MIGVKQMSHKATFTLFLLVLCNDCFAQIVIKDNYLNIYASNYVKSLDEFVKRFNAEELKPNLDTLNSDNLRFRSILTLVDLQSFNVRDSSVVEQLVLFADTISKNDLFVNAEDGGLYAEAICSFSYEHKEIPINIVLALENIREDINSWVIVGVNGLKESNLMDLSLNGYINPTQHEVRFTELSSERSELSKFVSVNKKVDQLSYLLGMLKSKQLEFIICNKVRFHFVQVPGYVFIVEEVNKQLDNNSGFLINDIVKTEFVEKKNYVDQLLGIK